MGPKKKHVKKRARGMEEKRTGVGWREDREQWTVEMRPPMWLHYKLYFGWHRTKAEAMVARDYGALLRFGIEKNVADAGGFDPRESRLFYFEESLGIFQSMPNTNQRCKDIRRLYPQQVAPMDCTGPPPQVAPVDCTGPPPHVVFCRLARKDIADAIKLFRERHPDRLTTSTSSRVSPVSSPLVNPLPPAPMDASSSRVSPVSSPLANPLPPAPMDASSSRVSPELTPLENILVSPKITVAMDGSPRWMEVKIEAPLLEAHVVRRILMKSIQGAEAELKKASVDKWLEEAAVDKWLEEAAVDKWLEDLPPCTLDPFSIPAITESSE